MFLTVITVMTHTKQDMSAVSAVPVMKVVSVMTVLTVVTEYSRLVFQRPLSLAARSCHHSLLGSRKFDPVQCCVARLLLREAIAGEKKIGFGQKWPGALWGSGGSSRQSIF